MATKKKHKHRWRENGQHKQRSFFSRLERDHFALKVRQQAETPVSTLTFGEFAETWLERHCMQAETTRRGTRAALDDHLIPALGALKLPEVRKSHLLELRSQLRQKEGRKAETKLTSKTVNNLMGLARQILQAALEFDHIAVNPANGIRALAKEKSGFGFWTAEERDAFLSFCEKADPQFAELVLVACHTGLRKGELSGLRRDQLDFDRRQIRVDAVYCPKLKQRFERTKNGEVGHVPMNQAVIAALASRRTQPRDAAVFEPRLFTDCYDRLRRRCRQLGMREIRFHDLRHTTASTLVMAGVPLYTVQRIMRHKSIAMTERYAHLSPNHLADAMETLVRQSVRVDTEEEDKLVNLFEETWRPRQGSNVLAA